MFCCLRSKPTDTPRLHELPLKNRQQYFRLKSHQRKLVRDSLQCNGSMAEIIKYIELCSE